MNSRDGFGIEWYSYNLPKLINGAGNSYSQFFYTAERDRWKQMASYGGTPETTIYIGGLVEKVTLGSTISWRHYIAGGSGPVAVYTRKSTGTNELHYLTHDHLGSIDSITDSTGAVETLLSYGAFGERRNATGWTGNPTPGTWTEITDATRRGFTSHEMLDNLNLTHMNGRVYDQVSGRFLSADPFVPDPGFTQSFNRYSYVYNNPLSYTDPSGFEPSPDDPFPGDHDFCNRICIYINANFDLFPGRDFWDLRMRRGTPPPVISLRGGSTVVPIKNLERDIVGGEVRKASTTREQSASRASRLGLLAQTAASYPGALIDRTNRLFHVVADNVHVKLGFGATLYGEAKFGFGSLKGELISATLGTKGNLSLNDGYLYARGAAPGITLRITKLKGCLGLGSIEGRTGTAGRVVVTQAPDASLKVDMTPEDLKELGRFGGAVGLRFIEAGFEIDLGQLLEDLGVYFNE